LLKSRTIQRRKQTKRTTTTQERNTLKNNIEI
jgi:hypothetical protein